MGFNSAKFLSDVSFVIGWKNLDGSCQLIVMALMNRMTQRTVAQREPIA